jgi:transposase
MARPSKYPAEFRDRAVRMVLESTAEYGSQWAAIMSICKQLGVNHETLRKWVRQAEADSGHQPGITTEQLDANLAGLVAPHGDEMTGMPVSRSVSRRARRSARTPPRGPSPHFAGLGS